MLNVAHEIIHGKLPHSRWEGARPEHLPAEACDWAALSIAEQCPSPGGAGARAMSEKGPQLKPHRLHEFAWWYEEEAGIVVVQESRRPDGTHLATEQVPIPWKRLINAAKRCGALR